MNMVTYKIIKKDEENMRLDRWFKLYYPQISHAHLQKLLRKGEVRLDGGRIKANIRLKSGQKIRIPPLNIEKNIKNIKFSKTDADFLRSIVLYEDDDLYVFNKPPALAVQGGSGTANHIDKMLKSFPCKEGENLRLVHRLDRDTSGCLIVAKTRKTAAHFGKIFRTRSVKKIYWAITIGVPNPMQGKISCFLAKEGNANGEQMVVVNRGQRGAQYSQTYYSTTDHAGREYAWITLKPVTGRTHQLRVHMMHLGVPILDDPRYNRLDNYNWQRPQELGRGLHLHARRLIVPLLGGRILDISAPLPEHMQKTFNLLGFDADRYDVKNIDPETTINGI